MKLTMITTAMCFALATPALALDYDCSPDGRLRAGAEPALDLRSAVARGGGAAALATHVPT